MNKFLKTVFCLAASLMLATTAQAAYYGRLTINVSPANSGTVGGVTGSSGTVTSFAASQTVDRQRNTNSSMNYTIAAQASDGYVFTGWTSTSGATATFGNASSASTTCNFTSTSQNQNNRTLATITANFAPITYYARVRAQLASNSAGRGTVNASATTTAGAYTTGNSDLTLSRQLTTGNVTAYLFAQANDGYVFKGWATTDNGTTFESSDSPFAATLNANSTSQTPAQTVYYAVFDEEPTYWVVSRNAGYTTFAAAYRAAALTDEIQLMKNATFTTNDVFTIGKNLTLSSYPGGTYTLTRGSANTAFAVDYGMTLKLSNIVVDGANLNANAAMFTVRDGSFTLANGATIQNCRNTTSQGGAIYAAADSVVNLAGGTIAGCAAAAGGAVYLETTNGVSSANAPYKYFKFVAKKTYGSQPMQLSELKLFDANGTRINVGGYTAATKNTNPSQLAERQCVYLTPSGNPNAAPWQVTEGPEMLFDGNTATKLGGDCYLSNLGDDTTWLSIAFRVPDSAPAAASYMITTANDSTNQRNPTDWSLYGSVDGTNWTELDSRHVDTPTTSYFVDYSNTPWPIDGIHVPSSDAFYTYYRFTFKKSYNDTRLQLAELSLYDAANNRVNGGGYTYVANAAATSLQPGQVTLTGNNTLNNNDVNTYTPANLFDGNAGSRTLLSGGVSFNDASNQSSWVYLTFRLKAGAAQPAKYSYTTFNQNYGIPGRNPSVWTVEGSTDGSTWVELDSRTGQGATPSSLGIESERYSFDTSVPVVPTATAPAILYVSGAPTVVNNTLLDGTAHSNVQPNEPDQVQLVGVFSGSVGVNWPTNGVVSGAQFGIVKAGSVAKGFSYDGDPAAYQGQIDGSTLVWTAKDPDPVCRIGDTTYISLEAALAAAQADDTIVLLRDITQNTALTISKNVTIDGDGHKLTRGVSGALTVTSNVTMRGLTIDGANVTAAGPMLTVASSGTLDLVNSNVTRCSNGGVHAVGHLSVAGSTSITGNQNGNLTLAGNSLFSVSGPLTGTISVAYPSTVTDGSQFGVITSAYEPTILDLTSFYCENDATFGPLILDEKLIWTNQIAKYPDGGKTLGEIIADSGDAPITVIAIEANSGDGGDLVIPAGRNVVIDLKGKVLTQNIIANGNVTIIDSTADQNGKLVGTLTQNEGGRIEIEAGTYTQRPDDDWLAPNRLVVDNSDGTFTVAALAGTSTVTGCTLDTRRGVRLVEDPYEDVLPLTYASSNWVFQASTNQALRSYVAVADALPIVDGDFANAQWHNGMVNNVGQGPVGQGDKSYDYPSANSNIVEISTQKQLYFGPNESEVVWQEWRYGLVQAVTTNETGYLRAWYKFPEADSNIIPILPGDPEKVQYPGYPDPDDMNTPGDEDYPGYSITNDVTHPWIVVPDPINPYTPDPSDPEHKVITNYVAQTPTIADPANTEMELLIRVVGPGTLTWNDLLIDGSEEQDSWMKIRIDDGPEIEIHRGGMEDWDFQKIVYGGDTDTVHTVRITYKGNSSGDTVNQPYGYIDNIIWDPYVPVVYEQVKDDESLPFVFENLGTEPTEENSGETHYYQNGSTTFVIQPTVSTVDEDGRQLTSQTTNSTEVTSTSTGTEDYWYAIPDPGPSNVLDNVIAQTAPTLGTNEVAVMTVTGIDGPSKFYWDMKIEEEGDPETPARLDVVYTKTYTDPDTGKTTVTVITNTFTAAEVNEWSHGYKPLPGEIGSEYTVDFIFTNNSDGSAVCKIDDIGWIRPDINIAPEMHDEDDGRQPPNGSAYGADDKMRPDPTSPDNVNHKDDPYYPDYTLENESRNPWEVVPDPKDGDDASNPGRDNDDVAQTPDSLQSGEETKITINVEGEGELQWKSFIDDGDGSSDVPAEIVVLVDGKTNQVYTSSEIIVFNDDGTTTTNTIDSTKWIDHGVFVYDRDDEENSKHLIEIIYKQEVSDNPDSTGYVDNFVFKIQAKALWIIDHEDPGDGWVYLAFEPELMVQENVTNWITRMDSKNKILVSYGRVRIEAETNTPVVAHLSTKPGHEPKIDKVWIKASLKDLNEITVVEPIGFWRIWIAGNAIKLSGIDDGPTTQSAEPPNGMPIGVISTNGAISVNTFGILKVESRTTNTLVAVPWTWYSKKEREALDIPVNKIVKTTNLDPGDMLYAYGDNGAYAAWLLDATTNWVPCITARVAKFGDTENNITVMLDGQGARRISRGLGFWLHRNQPLGPDNQPRPFWVYGQSVTTLVTNTVPGVEKAADLALDDYSYIMLGNPYAHEVNLNQLQFVGTIGDNDTIMIPDGLNASKFVYRRKNKNHGKQMEWCWVDSKIINGVPTNVYHYDDLVIPPGTGFWYIRRTEGDLKVIWQ